MALRDLTPWTPRTLRAHNPQNTLANLQDQMERTFNEIWNGFGNPLAGGLMWGNGAAGRGLAGFAGLAATDICETDKDIEVCVDLPGFEEKDIDVSLANQTLTIKAESSEDKDEDRQGVIYSERRRGAVHRTIALPDDVDLEKCEASFDRGVLTVRLQKSERARASGRRIPLTPNAQNSAPRQSRSVRNDQRNEQSQMEDQEPHAGAMQNREGQNREGQNREGDGNARATTH